MPEPRRTFGPVLVVGLASAALAAVAASKPMARVDADWLDRHRLRGVWETHVERAGGDELPLASALALVLLAAWGVLLVTRGLVRRAVAVGALLAAGGVVAAAAVGFPGLRSSMRDDLAPMLGGRSVDDIPVAHTGWYWTLLVAGAVAVVATAAAVRWAGSWPEMGSRYDAPGGDDQAVDTGAEPEQQTNLDLWKSLDEGHDPTA